MKKQSKNYLLFNSFLYCNVFYCIIFLLFSGYAPIAISQEAVVVENPDVGVAAPASAAGAAAAVAVPLNLTVKLGAPDSDAPSQIYQLNSGETAFVQTSAPSAAAKQTPEEKREAEEYKKNLANISTAISGKITQIQNKQIAVNNELYIAQVAPLNNDLRGLQDQLNTLEQSRTKLVADHTAREASRPPPPPTPAPEVAAGISIRATIEKDRAVMQVITQNDVESSVDAPLGQWVQVYSNEDGSEVWAKVDPRS